jgi:hypothetical protein
MCASPGYGGPSGDYRHCRPRRSYGHITVAAKPSVKWTRHRGWPMLAQALACEFAEFLLAGWQPVQPGLIEDLDKGHHFG